MDPASELFRGRCEANPALLGACTVLWWPGWSAAMLQQLPAVRLRVGGPACCWPGLLSRM
jgi:hypothetical protein